MKPFEIEHIGVTVKEPVKMAQWYKNVMGFDIKLSSSDDESENSVAFVADKNGKVLLEFGKVAGVEKLSSRINHHLQFHMAVKSDDPDKDMQYLVDHGAKFIETCPTKPGDHLVVLYDPWGNCIQLVKRSADLLAMTNQII
jgi:catechol-2,3-dioxygenase